MCEFASTLYKLFQKEYIVVECISAKRRCFLCAEAVAAKQKRKPKRKRNRWLTWKRKKKAVLNLEINISAKNASVKKASVNAIMKKAKSLKNQN